jgi:hypothetical protein
MKIVNLCYKIGKGEFVFYLKERLGMQEHQQKKMK